MTAETLQLEPLEVNSSPLPDQLWAGLRQVAPPLLAFALGRGWIPDDIVPVATVVGGVVWAIIAGQLKTRRRAKELTALASAAPDSVAVLRSR